MSRSFQVYIGIDINIGARPVTFIALDEEQQPLAIGDGDLPDALAYAAGQMAGALVAVNAASRPNRGRMKRVEVRQVVSPAPARGKWTVLRQVEYELIQAGLSVPETPVSPEPWVKRGFSLAQRLEALGYQPFDPRAQADDSPRQWLETNADACFGSILGVAPLAAGTLEGRIQRQLVLRDESLEVPDAMEFFEEVTRFKILKSNLPIKNIFPQAEINAWMAAHTAWLAVNEPERLRSFGEPEEGVVFLPGPRPDVENHRQPVGNRRKERD